MIAETNFLKRHALVIGIILMFLFTWPIDLSNSGLMPFKVPFIVYLFLGWGFIAAAVLMTWLTLGSAAVGQLLQRYVKWRVRWTWYLALLIMPAAALLGVYLNAALTGAPPDFSHVTADQLRPPGFSRLAFLIPFFLIDLIANGEEIGWRGYVLPRLQTRHSALIAALITGVIWGFWHVPKFLTHWDWGYFALFMLDTIAKSVFLAWMYNGTRGSLLLVLMAHAAWNTAGIFIPVASTISTENLGALVMRVVIEMLLAIVIVLLAGPANLSRTESRQVTSADQRDMPRSSYSPPVPAKS
jgi:CAAX protease family protein